MKYAVIGQVNMIFEINDNGEEELNVMEIFLAKESNIEDIVNFTINKDCGCYYNILTESQIYVSSANTYEQWWLNQELKAKNLCKYTIKTILS